jgi:transcription factor SFP1
MRDFSCCGQTLPTLHDLLQHYEECHAQQTPQSLRTATQHQQARDQQQPNSKAAIASQAATSVQQQAQQQRQQQQQQQLNRTAPNAGFGTNKPSSGISSLTGGIQQMRQHQSQPATPTQKTVQPSMDDMDGVEDMEMDDAIGPMDPVDTPLASNQRPVQPAQQSMFGQQQRQSNLINTAGILHQGLRTSQPNTPSASGFGFQNNPTVSSVNTPTLSAQNNTRFSPDNSIPGTPSEMDEDFTTMNMDINNLGNMNMNMNMNNMNFPYGFGNDLGLDLCIDEPAKRLFSPNGGFGNQRALQQQFAQFGLGNGQFGNNDDLVRRLRQQQMMQMQGFGNASAAMMMAGEEHKPFRCPVIGCEKAYKNQNGLK